MVESREGNWLSGSPREFTNDHCQSCGDQSGGPLSDRMLCVLKRLPGFFCVPLGMSRFPQLCKTPKYFHQHYRTISVLNGGSSRGSHFLKSPQLWCSIYHFNTFESYLSLSREFVWQRCSLVLRVSVSSGTPFLASLP